MSEEAPQQEVGDKSKESVESEPKLFDKSYVKQLRDEAANYRVKLKEYEDAQKTEAQKNQDALDAAQKELEELRAGKLRAEIAGAKSVPVELLAGNTREELEAVADALIKFKGEASKTFVIPGEGQSPSGGGQSSSSWSGVLQKLDESRE